MATSPAKISWEMPRKRENKKNRSDEFVPDPSMKIRKKKAKKYKKLKNTIIASFQANISSERPRKRKKKNRSDKFLLDP